MSTRRKPPTDPRARLRTMRADIHRLIAEGIELGMPEEAEGHLATAADNLSDAEEFMAASPPVEVVIEEGQLDRAEAKTEGAAS